MVTACDLPAGSLLERYVRAGAYVDCYVTEFAAPVTLARFVEAFYSTAVFGVERRILQWIVSRPSTLDQARQLGAGEIDAFAAWRVEDRNAEQLLLAEFTGRTRSWLMVAGDGASPTRLYFGSAVVPRTDPRSGRRSMGPVFGALLGFHKMYSRVLLSAARRRLARHHWRPGREKSNESQ